MTLASRLKSSVSGAVRAAAGAALGLGLVAAFVGAPAAWGQEAASVRASAFTPSGIGPALWVIKDEDSTIWLFGTVHVLRPTTIWQTPTVLNAFESADEIWFEIPDPSDAAGMAPFIMQHGLSPDRPLNTLLTPAEYAKLGEAAGAVGIPVEQLNLMRPWLVGLTLAVAPLTRAGYDANSGIELVLRQRALAAGKPVKGLETAEEQIKILAGLSEDTQLDFLRQSLESYDDASVELDGLVDAWQVGDVRGIQRLGVDEMRRASQEVHDALLTRRNVNWAGQIETMLEGEGEIFIAVGSAHLAGPQSVQAILGRRGVRVERVQ